MKFEVKRVKIVVTVPEEDVDKIRNAVCDAGAGVIGDYSFCTMSTKCTGTFMPNDNANPYICNNNNKEYVTEEKLEVVCDVEKVKSVISALRKVHPYEEPAIDIYPLIDEDNFA